MIVLKNITMTLNPSSIAQAIMEIELFEKKLKPAMQCLIDYLGEKGVEIARAELIFFDQPAYDTGALSESVRYENRGGTGYVMAGEGLTNASGEPTNYAIYIEFGNNTKYPNGFWYPDPGGWRTVKSGKHAGETYSWTPGYGPRPFMGNTLLDLVDEAEVAGGRVIAEYIRGERA